MKRKTRKILVLVAILIAICVIIVSLRSFHGGKPVVERLDKDGKVIAVPSGEAINHARVKSNPLTGFMNAFKTRIDLHGKVVDQRGKPIEGASVTVHAHAKPFRDGSAPVAKLTSGSDGRFSILGLKGYQLAVLAEKEGFIYYSPLGGPTSGSMVTKSTTPESPVILTLHDPGPMEPLIHVHKKLWNLKPDGTPRRIALDSEKGAGTHQIEFRFNSEWRNLPMDNDINKKLFDWSFEIRIQGGGLIRNKNDLKKEAAYQFEAPEDGYQESIKYNFPASSPSNWNAFFKDSFFVKFPDNTYGRIRFDVEGFTDRNPLYMETFWNPKAGSRNLSSLNK